VGKEQKKEKGREWKVRVIMMMTVMVHSSNV
jgi:hypothetical protein